MCKPRTIFYLLWLAGPSGLAFYVSRPARLPSWLGMMNAGWPGSMQSEFSCEWNSSCFKVVPQNRLSFYLSSLLLECYYFVDLILDSMWITLAFYYKFYAFRTILFYNACFENVFIREWIKQIYRIT